jgi:hypothetical protein
MAASTTTYREPDHPRVKGGSKGGQWKEKGVWSPDAPMLSRRSQIASSATMATSSLFLVFDSLFKFIAALFTLGTVSLLARAGVKSARRSRTRQRRYGLLARSKTRLRWRYGTIRGSGQQIDAYMRNRREDRKLRWQRRDQKVQAVGKAARVAGQKTAAGARKARTKLADVRAKRSSSSNKDPFVMTKDEMRSAADSIGLRHEGRRVQLLDVNESRGEALIVDRGSPRNVPVAKLSWDG